MRTENLLRRITVNPKAMVGKPVIRGLRITVEQILKALAGGVTIDDLLEEYPELETEDIQAALLYASKLGRRGTCLRCRIDIALNNMKDSQRGRRQDWKQILHISGRKAENRDLNALLDTLSIKVCILLSYPYSTRKTGGVACME